jgi:hypothetical protein
MCLAQSSADTQAGASASQDTSVSANKSGVQADSNASANAAQGTAVSGRDGQAQAAGQLQAGSTVQAELTKPVDARKNKPGDEVVAKTTQDVKSNGQTVLPKGSKLVGHITDVQAREKGQQESHMAIAFEHAILKNGTQVPMALTLQAIGSSQANAAAAMDDSAMAGSTMAGSTMANENMSGMATSSGSGATRGALGGVTSTTGHVANTAGTATRGTLNTGTSAGAGVAGGLTSTSRGVVGFPGMTLSSATASSTNAGSVISSTTSNVHLDSGTQMILRANGQ